MSAMFLRVHLSHTAICWVMSPFGNGRSWPKSLLFWAYFHCWSGEGGFVRSLRCVLFVCLPACESSFQYLNQMTHNHESWY